MRDFSIKEVKNKKDFKEFLDFPARLYKGDKNWIRPLDKDIEDIFNPQENKFFRTGDAIRWILKNNEGKTIGKVAAFFEKNTAKSLEQLTGGVGFFDCIDDQEAANMLFDAAKKWLEDKGMEAMDGPINFGTRENFWGCLIEGFYEPVYKMNYNYPYYAKLFENYGFKNYFNQYTYHMPLDPSLLSRSVLEKAERIKKHEDYSVLNYERKNPDKYINDFITIFNEAWARFPGVKPMKKIQAAAMFKAMSPILDPRLLIFEYYKDRPIAFFIMIPDINQVLKSFNGKLNLINKLTLVMKVRFLKRVTRALGLIFGVVPDFQGKGLEAAMIAYFAEEVIEPGFNYTDLEMNWIGDFNPSMMKLMDSIGAKIRKVHVTYRYLFDQNKTFVRASKV
jgi:GNAT superfamily N-acetyltransferase